MKVTKQKIEEKSRSLQAKWTVTYSTPKAEASAELEEDIARILQEEIDWEIICDIMKQVGWTKVEVDWPERIDESKAHEIKEWCKDTLQGNYKGRGKIWLFERSEDAMWFTLRWSS